MIDRIDLTVMKNTPNLRTPATTHTELSAQNHLVPVEEKLDAQFRPKGTPNGDRRVVVRLIRAAHEIHYR